MAYLLGQGTRTLDDWRLTGAGPVFLRLGKLRSIRYRRRDLIAWMDDQAPPLDLRPRPGGACMARPAGESISPKSIEPRSGRLPT